MREVRALPSTIYTSTTPPFLFCLGFVFLKAGIGLKDAISGGRRARERKEIRPCIPVCVCVCVDFPQWRPEAGFVSSIRARGPEPETWPDIANESPCTINKGATWNADTRSLKRSTSNLSQKTTLHAGLASFPTPISHDKRPMRRCAR